MSLVEQELGRAAAAGDPFNQATVVTLLKQYHRIEQVKDDAGKPTDKFKVVIDLPVENSAGAEVTMTLDPNAAVAKMKDDAAHANLWKANCVSGLGSNSHAGTGANGKIDVRSLTPAQYQEIRAKNPELLGLRKNHKHR
jgi:hypothetical protein